MIMTPDLDRVIQGDCLEVLSGFPPDFIDLVVTSPPYADKRKDRYDGIPSDKYVEWFLPIASQIMRVLKPTGSFVLNIKEGTKNGERETYVMELVLALRRAGWKWVDDYCWSKTTSMPGRWPNRLRDAWEHCHHFTKQGKFAMYQEAVMVPAAEATKKRGLLALRKPEECATQYMQTGSGISTNRSKWAGRDMVFPSNVINFPLECSNVGHPAAFPIILPSWFIKLFSEPGGVVLDPFSGSGTTCVAANRLGRKYLGIDKEEKFCEVARARISGKGSITSQGESKDARNSCDAALVALGGSPTDSFGCSLASEPTPPSPRY